jgi:hypothetical protein
MSLDPPCHARQGATVAVRVIEGLAEGWHEGMEGCRPRLQRWPTTMMIDHLDRGSARGRLHDGVDDVASDLAAHILVYAHREPVVEAGPNAGVRYLLVIGLNVGPSDG